MRAGLVEQSAVHLFDLSDKLNARTGVETTHNN